VVASANARPTDIAFTDLLASAPTAFTARPDDTAKLLLTSGSTGRPKAVIGLHRNIAVNAAQIAACFDDPDPPVVVNAAPWSHSLGANAILHMVLHRGGTLYIDAGQPTSRALRRDDPQPVGGLADLSQHGPGRLGPVRQRAGEGRRPGADLLQARVRVLQYGGASIAQSIIDRVQAVAIATIGERVTFATGYGSTETGPTACNIHWLNGRGGMIGLPVPGTAVKLVPAGEKFEIRVKGPQISPGYLGEPQLSADVFDDEGFYRLGDAARAIDPADPEAGLMFDGRLVENFKLASGTFVAAGALRVAAVSAIGGAALDAVVCGEGQEGVGLMLFLDPTYNARHPDPAEVRAAIRAGIGEDERGGEGWRRPDLAGPDPGRRPRRRQRRADRQGLHQPGHGAGSPAGGGGASLRGCAG
jgi:feruloyl-CoA synthase